MSGAPVQLFLRDGDDTEALAQLLAQTQPASAVVHLQGDLGAGKSTLARAWLRALGVHGAIRSPTYTLVERYPLRDGGEALHLDLYRVGDAGELEFFGLDDAQPTLWLIEWPERAAAGLPAPDLRVELAIKAAGRTCTLHAFADSGRSWLSALHASGRLRRFYEP